MHKKILTLFLTGFLLGSSSTAFAGEPVKVTLPTFPVTLNNQTLNNDYSQYPFLVYKDITYVPMTYYDCRLLGLKTDWSLQNGLAIDKNSDVFNEYERTVNSQKNRTSLTAQIADGKIKVNGKTIQNNKEEYPLLFFRDVTYFPLTWRFAVEEFGWDYHFSHKNGLVISSPSIKTDTSAIWNNSTDSFGNMMGSNDLTFGVSFLPKQQTCTVEQACKQLNVQTLDLYHFSEDTVTILPSSELWEYQVYRIINNQEHLIYKKQIPFFSGKIAGRQYAYSNFSAGCWNEETIQKGSYVIRLTHPDKLRYKTADGKTRQEILREGTGGAFFFESHVTIR